MFKIFVNILQQVQGGTGYGPAITTIHGRSKVQCRLHSTKSSTTICTQKRTASCLHIAVNISQKCCGLPGNAPTISAADGLGEIKPVCCSGKSSVSGITELGLIPLLPGIGILRGHIMGIGAGYFYRIAILHRLDKLIQAAVCLYACCTSLCLLLHFDPFLCCFKTSGCFRGFCSGLLFW